MKDISTNEIKVILALFKGIENNYNSNNLSKKLGISAMGCLKILKKLEKQELVKSQLIGRSIIYKPNFKSDYSKKFIEFALHKEAVESNARIKRWIYELKKLEKNCEVGILFGSVLTKEDYNDVDTLLIIKPSLNKDINDIIEKINRINIKKIHALKQTKKDIINNLKEKNKVVLNAIESGIVVFGYDKIINLIKDARN